MDNLAERERQKYEQMWGVNAYRKHAPGEKLAQLAFEEMGMQKGNTLIDFGCGTGRPALQFQRMGAAVTGVDHASNCLDDRVNINFLKCCLWDMPPNLEADYGYCTDVMEHIPPEKVHDVLSEIKRIIRKKAFFQIATFPDGMGKHIGKTLHLTVQPASWWEAKLSEHWDNVTIRGNRNCIAIVQ